VKESLIEEEESHESERFLGISLRALNLSQCRQRFREKGEMFSIDLVQQGALYGAR
jgi:hypothetical protein